MKKHHKMADDGESKKKKKGGAVTPSLKDCANCGAPEGTVPGSPAHSVCSRCKITYYCSVKCQKRHWKQGGHKQHCMTPEQRSASAAAAAAEESSPKRGVAAEEEEGECAICLESLGSGVEILECGHRFHKACVDELIKRDVQQACPLCRVQLPATAEKMYDDALSIIVRLERSVGQPSVNAPWGPLNRQQKRDFKGAKCMLEKAAEEGVAKAGYLVGQIYMLGWGVDVNYKKAFEWYEKAAEQGSNKAQNNLGIMYQHGLGVDVNYKKAIEWYEKAAEQGYADAQYNLALMYRHGQGVAVNYTRR